MRYRYIDVLKAFAIIAVVLYHAGVMPFGYLGVDLFLVISGYLVTKSLVGKGWTNYAQIGGGGVGWKSYFEFEVSRVERLLPILLVAGFICMAVGFYAMLPDDYENLSETVIATNLFGNNILSAITTKNYWDIVNEYKPLMHTWYVGVLMQFYLVYPILFVLSKNDKKKSHRTLLTMMLTLTVVSLLIYYGTTDTAKRFYYLPSRFFELSVGGVVALTGHEQKRHYLKSSAKCTSHKWFVYVCYVLLLSLMAVNYELISAKIKLLLVVALSVVLIKSSSLLENKWTANGILAKIGAASYSIFIWHQVLLAFYRYTYSNHFTALSYIMLLVAIGLSSWLTYHFVEQKTSGWLKGRRKIVFYILVACFWLCLTGFAGYIYKNGGVVRDVPELYISKNEKTDHKIYNDKIYELDKPFKTSKHHWLVVGNSFGRDFANVILESSIADSVEVSYIYSGKYRELKYGERFANADIIFLSSLGTSEKTIRELEYVCIANGFDVRKLVIVGTKNFGECNGQFYIRRYQDDYFSQRTLMEDGYLETNNKMKEYCGERYLDLIGLVIDENGTMPVFTPDHHYVSQDCRHFSRGGAIWFAQLIDWDRYLNRGG